MSCSITGVNITRSPLDYANPAHIKNQKKSKKSLNMNLFITKRLTFLSVRGRLLLFPFQEALVERDQGTPDPFFPRN